MIKGIFTNDLKWQLYIETVKDEYAFQKDLTIELDAKYNAWTDIDLLKVVLWKVNRYPEYNFLFLKI
jgi:hypothetical protein